MSTQLHSLVIDVQKNAILTSEIVRVQDQISLNNTLCVSGLKLLIVARLKEYLGNRYDDENYEKLASYLSGSYFLEVRQELKFISSLLPHLTNHFKSALAQIMFSKIMEHERKLDKAFGKLQDKMIKEDGAMGLTDEDLSASLPDLQALEAMKNIHAKTNPYVAQFYKKHLVDQEKLDVGGAD